MRRFCLTEGSRPTRPCSSLSCELAPLGNGKTISRSAVSDHRSPIRLRTGCSTLEFLLPPAVRFPPLHSCILATANWCVHRQREYVHMGEPATSERQDHTPDRRQHSLLLPRDPAPT